MGTTHQGAPGLPGAPRWVVPTRDTFRTPFFYSLLVPQDKKSLYTPRMYWPPYHGEIFCYLFLLFSIRSIKPSSMCSSSSNNMEEDAWLMKIEMKLKEAKGKLRSSSPPPSSSPPKENWVSGMGTPLGFRQAWGRCPGIVSPPLSFAFTYFSLIFCFRWIKV